MSYKDGEIYFVREVDREGAYTPFVKIGLVRYKDKRDSFNRLAEHQTGNPRKLHLDSTLIVKTPAVDRVEAFLHRIYASKRISGEWFLFDDSEAITAAIKRAEDLAQETSALVPLFEKAEKLKMVPSKGSATAKQEHLDLAREMAIATLQLKVCKALEAEIKVKLVAAVGAGESVESAASTGERNYAPKFLTAEFKGAHPELWKQYLREESTWYQRFMNKCKVTEADFDTEFADAIADVKAQIDSCQTHSQVGLLNEPTLTLTHLSGIAEWNRDISEAKLKIALDSLEELTGTCTWLREDKVSTNFDSQNFAADHPELAKKFLSEPVKKEYVKAKKTLG